MKRLLFVLSIVSVGLVVMAFSSNKNVAERELANIGTAELAGLWRDSNTTVYKKSTVLFSVEGSQLEMMHYMEWKGKPFLEKGRGKIYGRKLDYFVVVTKPIPGWALTGEHFLTLSADGRTLRGAFEDENGTIGALVFKKVGK
jgi:hypothetical protein